MLIPAIDNVHAVVDTFLEKQDVCLPLMKVLAIFDLFSKIGTSVLYKPESKKM